MFKQFSFASTIIYLWYFFVNINISSKSISVPSRSPTYTILCGTEFAHCSTAACCRRESREARTVGLMWRKVFGRFYNILQKKSKEYGKKLRGHWEIPGFIQVYFSVCWENHRTGALKFSHITYNYNWSLYNPVVSHSTISSIYPPVN